MALPLIPPSIDLTENFGTYSSFKLWTPGYVRVSLPSVFLVSCLEGVTSGSRTMHPLLVRWLYPWYSPVFYTSPLALKYHSN